MMHHDWNKPDGQLLSNSVLSFFGESVTCHLLFTTDKTAGMRGGFQCLKAFAVRFATM